MRKKSQRFYRYLMLFLTTGALIALSPLNVHAGGWVDDWLDQKNTTPAGHFEGQKRGYWTGGSFSGRVHTSKDYFATVMPPRVSAGCGGIDIFSGGLGLLDFDYLVDKLQNILQAAPAAAFDLALNVLCEPCATTIKSLTAIADQLNQIQLDDCKASKAMVTTIANPFISDPSKKAALHEEVSKFETSSGIGGTWTKIKEESMAIYGGWFPPATKEPSGSGSGPSTSPMLTGCPAIVKRVYTTNGSVLEHVADESGFNNEDLLDMIRGVTGDLIITKVDGMPRAVYEPACSENANKVFDNLLEGEIYRMTVSSSGKAECSIAPSVNIDLTEFVGKKMASIADKIRGGVALTAEETNFIDSNPLSLGTVLKMAVGTKQEFSIVSSLADITAKAYVYQFLQDLYGTALWISDEQTSISSASSLPPEQCSLAVLGTDVIGGGQEIRKKVLEMERTARTKFIAGLTEANIIYNFVNKMAAFYDVLQKSTVGDLGSFSKENS